MLDLSAYNIRKFEVKIGGEKLRLLPPKVSQVETINTLAKKIMLGDAGDSLSEAATIILNRNDKGKEFDTSFFKEKEFDVAYKLVLGYIGWVNEIYKNPNSESPSAKE